MKSNPMHEKHAAGMAVDDIARTIATMPENVTTIGMAELIVNMIDAYEMQSDWPKLALLVGGALSGKLSMHASTVMVGTEKKNAH